MKGPMLTGMCENVNHLVYVWCQKLRRSRLKTIGKHYLQHKNKNEFEDGDAKLL